MSHPRKAALGIIICAKAKDPNGPRLTGSEGSPEVQAGMIQTAGCESGQGKGFGRGIVEKRGSERRLFLAGKRAA